MYNKRQKVEKDVEEDEEVEVEDEEVEVEDEEVEEDTHFEDWLYWNNEIYEFDQKEFEEQEHEKIKELRKKMSILPQWLSETYIHRNMLQEYKRSEAEREDFARRLAYSIWLKKLKHDFEDLIPKTPDYIQFFNTNTKDFEKLSLESIKEARYTLWLNRNKSNEYVSLKPLLDHIPYQEEHWHRVQQWTDAIFLFVITMANLLSNFSIDCVSNIELQWDKKRQNFQCGYLGVGGFDEEFEDRKEYCFSRLRRNIQSCDGDIYLLPLTIRHKRIHHSNMILVKKLKKIVYVFEPHGHSTKTLMVKLPQILKDIGLNGYKIIPQGAFCPYDGPQEHVIIDPGYCTTFSTWFALGCVLNPHTDPAVVVNDIMNRGNKQVVTMNIRKFSILVRKTLALSDHDIRSPKIFQEIFNWLSLKKK